MQRFVGVSRGWLYPGIVLAIACAMVASPWTHAEEPAADASPEPAILAETDQTQPPVAPEPEPPVAPEPEQLPVAPEPGPPVAPEPEQPPVAPEPEPPVAPEPEQQPVAPEPEEPPADPGPEAPVQPVVPDPVQTEEPEPVQTEEPQPTATEVPEAEVTPTPEPSPTPEPTAEPTPVVTWSQTRPVRCELRDGQAAGLEFNQTRTYHCEVSAQVSSDIAMPTDMEIEWKLDVNFPDSYQLRFPQGSLAQVKEQIPNGHATTYTIVHPWIAGSEQKLAFQIDATRTTCATGDQVLGIQARPEIDTRASEAEITRQDGNTHPEPARIISPVVDSEAPVITFDGPITFEDLSATSGGLESDVSRGSATIVVNGEWDPCTTWTVDLSGTVNVPAETPAKFRAVSINNESISGGACDLSAPCDLFVLPQTRNAATPLRYTIGLELQLHAFTPVGEFGITLKSDVRGVGTQP